MIYIASPYSHPSLAVREHRASAVMAFCAEMVQHKPLRVLYSPIASWHEIAKRHSLPKDFAFWQHLNMGMLRLAEELWVLRLQGWEDSLGVIAEIEHATAMGIPIRHFLHNGQEVV